MKPRNKDRALAEPQSQATKPRFKIEKLEDRIAPRKGGIPGPPGDDDVGGKGRAGCRGSGCDR